MNLTKWTSIEKELGGLQREWIEANQRKDEEVFGCFLFTCPDSPVEVGIGSDQERFCL